MKKIILRTGNDWTGFILRLTVGLVLLPHGAQKMLGSFDGYGFSATMDYLTAAKHLPWLISFIVIVIEFIGSLSLIAGFASRVWSALVIILMIGAVLVSHFDNGFFMNWSGNQEGEGFEYHLLVIGLSLATLINGSGKYSLDKLLTKENPIQK